MRHAIVHKKIRGSEYNFGAEIYIMKEKKDKERRDRMAGSICEFRRRMSICGMIQVSYVFSD